MLLDEGRGDKIRKKYDIHTINATKGTKGRPSGGLMFGWKIGTDLIILEESRNYVILSVPSLQVFVFFVYISPDLHYPEVLSAVFAKISTFCDKGKKLFILGDLNGRIGELNSSPEVRSSMDITVNSRGKQLIENIASAGLLICNGMLEGDTNGAVTFNSESVRGSSVVDLCLFSPNSSPIITKFEVLDSPYSDHFPIMLTLNLPTSDESSFLTTTSPLARTKERIVLPTNDLYEFKTKLDARLVNLPDTDDVNVLNSCLITEITSTCQELHFLRQPKSIPQSQGPRWFDTECRSLKKLFKSNLRKLRQNKIPMLRPHLEAKFQEAKERYKSTMSLKEENDKLETQRKLLNHNNSIEFWDAYKRIQYKPPAPNPINKERWFEHYKSVFSTLGPYVPTSIQIPNDYVSDELLDREFNVFEIQSATKRLKSNKAAGIDLVPNEVWKIGSPMLLLSLCSLFQLCYTTGKVPLAWCEAVILPLWKKGCTQTTSNYRPISLLNTILKLFTSTLNARLNYWARRHLKISQFQAGFQKNKSCLDHIFVLNSMIQTQLLKNQKLYACFVDLSQAFDTPNHKLLWKVLLQAGVSLKFVRIFSFIYEHAFARVSTPEGLTEPINIMKGVLQGESASPSLFNLFLEGIVNKLDSYFVAGINLQNIVVHILMYADDMVLVAPSKEALQTKIDILANFLHERGLNINLSKSQVVIFRRAGARKTSENFEFKGQPIEVVKTYKYLGVLFSWTGTYNLASSEFVRKGLAAQGATLSTTRRTKIFSLDLSTKLFDSIVKSTTLYAAGIWGLDKGEDVERVQQQYYKRTLRLPICTPKYFVRLETGRPHIALEILNLGLTMLDRILKSPPDSLLNQSYMTLKRISNLFPSNPKYSWYLQLRGILQGIGHERVLERNSATYLYLRRRQIIEDCRQNLGEADLISAKDSTRIPHYADMKHGYGAELYLQNNYPSYLVTCIAQTRLNYSIIYNKGSWHDLGMFEEVICRFCGEWDSFSHLFSCTHLSSLRAQLTPSSDPNNTLNIVQNNYNFSDCKNLYIFLSTALKARSLS
jgi:hypothetical protein